MKSLFLISLLAVQLKFAVITDSHITTADAPAAKALAECIEDINAQKDELAFVVHCGDETDFGNDEQEALIKSMLDGLHIPYHAIPGNHDATWSESGCNSFKTVFGDEQFCFEAAGWRFVGCPSGPDIRMSPALIPRETLVWLNELPSGKPTIFFNHYPINSEISNYREFQDTARDKGAKFFIGGHHHRNLEREYDGIGGILCRSVIPNRHISGNGYTIVTLEGGEDSDEWTLTASERHNPEGTFITENPWYSTTLNRSTEFRPKVIWQRTEDANVVAGFAVEGTKAWYGTTAGDVRCISTEDGSVLWTTHLDGKIYSTPAVCSRTVVIGCADGTINALDSRSGRIRWQVKAGKAVLASPAILDGTVYIGASDGVFRAIDLRSGRIIWTADNIRGHVIARPYVDDSQVVFGSWGRTLYSLDPRDGKIQWSWEHPHGSPMYSPAACPPKKAAGKLYLAIPDRKVWVFDAESGQPLKTIPGAREALGMDADGTRVFSKTMDSLMVCINAQTADELWRIRTPMGYDIGPSEIEVRDGIVYIPSDKGVLYAFSAQDGHLLWRRSFAPALVNPVSFDAKGRILASSMDGHLILLDPHQR